MQRPLATSVCITILRILILTAIATAEDQPIPILLVDGQSGGPYHNWQLTTPALKMKLEEAGLFQVTVAQIEERLRHGPRRAYPHGSELWKGKDFSYDHGARCCCAELRWVYDDLSAWNGMGRHGQGYAESTYHVSDC